MTKSINKIITGRDIASRDGYKNHQERIFGTYRKLSRRTTLNIRLVNQVDGDPVYALIDFGRWSARCECGGSEYVDPMEPIFYCFSCGNRENGGKFRPVVFPEEREEIERLALDRPVDDARGITDDQRALLAKPLVIDEGKVLSRSWLPGETVAEMKRQNEAIKKAKKDSD